MTGMTLDQFRAWQETEDYPQSGKVLFTDGRLYFDMSPERIDFHSALKTTLTRVLDTLVLENDLGRFYTDGPTIVEKKSGVSNEPDAVFASWETIKSRKLTIPKEKRGQHIEFIGTPDWVCEIVSDFSVDKDTKVLRQAYHKAGIPEYWLIDPRGDDIDFQLLVWHEEGYLAAADDAGWKQSPVFAREFRFTRQRDQVGWWMYDLEIK